MPKEIQFNNPAFRGVQAQVGKMYAPTEGEFFVYGGLNESAADLNRGQFGNINYIKDGQVKTLNLESLGYKNSGAYDENMNLKKGYSSPFQTSGQARIAGLEYLKSQGFNPADTRVYNGSDVQAYGGAMFKNMVEGSLDELKSIYRATPQTGGNIGAQTNIQGVGAGAATMDQAVAQGTATNYDAALGADKIAQLQASDAAQRAQAGTAPTAYNTAGTTTGERATFTTQSGQKVYGVVNQFGEFIPDTMPSQDSPLFNELKNNLGNISTTQEPPQALRNAQGDTIFLSPSDASYQSYINAGYSATTPSQVPPGATYISDPKMLSGLTESQIWREPGTNRIYKLPTPLPNTTSLSSVTPGSTGGPITLTGASTGGTPPASTTPYDALNKFGGNLGATALNDIDKILMGFYQNQIGQTQGDLAKAKGEVDALKGEMTALKSSTYLEGRAKQLFESGRVEELFDALSSNRRRMENEMTSMNMGLQGLTDQPIAAEIIYGQKRTLQEQATARVGVIAASTEAMLGELDRAIQISDRVFSAIKEDRNTQIGALEKLLDLADKNKTNLLADEKDAIKAQIGVLSDANTRMEKDKAAMQKLITDQPLIASAAGISFTDTYDQALNKILTQAGNKNSEVYRLLQATSKTGGSKSGSGSGAGTGTTTSGRIFEAYAKDIIDLEVALGGQAGSEAFDSIVDQALSDMEKNGVALNREQVRQGIIRELNKQKGQATPQFTQDEINLAKGITPENDFWSSLGVGSDLSVTSPEEPSGNFLASPEEMAARADAFVKAGPTSAENIGMVKKLGNWIKDSFNKGGIIGQYIPKE